jgi:hypothetical protein
MSKRVRTNVSLQRDRENRQRRLSRESPEETSNRLAADAALHAFARAVETPEQTSNRLAANAASTSSARFLETPEQTSNRRAADAALHSSACLAETPEQTSNRRAADAALHSFARSVETPEQTSNRLAANAASTSSTRSVETPEQTFNRLVANAASTSSTRSVETPEQTASRLAANAASTSSTRSVETPEETSNRLAANAAQTRSAYAIRRDEEQRDLRRSIDEYFQNPSQDPTSEILAQFESDVRIADMLFWEGTGAYRFHNLDSNSGLDDVEIVRQQLLDEMVTPEIRDRCHKDFYDAMAPNKELLICACCGERDYDSDLQISYFPLSTLSLLIVNKDKMTAFTRFSDVERKAFNYYIHKASDSVFDSTTHTIYHLLPFLRLPVDWAGDVPSTYRFPICLCCSKAILKGELPTFALANGHDYGNPVAALGADTMQTLTGVDKMCIAKNRMFSNMIKLKVARSHLPDDSLHSGLRGHIISFSHQGPAAMADYANRVLPHTDTLDFVRVIFLGSKKQAEHLKNTPTLHSTFIVHATLILNSLNMLKTVNIRYHDIIITATAEVERAMTVLQDGIVANIFVDSSMETAQAENYATSDIANVRGDSTGDDFEHILLANSPTAGSRSNIVGGVLQSLANALTLPDDVAGSSTTTGDNVLTPERPVPRVIPLGDTRHTIPLPRDQVPLNEFTENDRVFLDSFPFLFFLGSGWTAQGSANLKYIKHLMHYYDGRFSLDHMFLFALFNQFMRHRVAKDVKTQVFNGYVCIFIYLTLS